MVSHVIALQFVHRCTLCLQKFLYIIVLVGALLQVLSTCASLSDATQVDRASDIVPAVSVQTPSSSNVEPVRKKLRQSLFGYSLNATAADNDSTPRATPESQLTKYMALINQDSFDPDDHHNIFVDMEYNLLRPLFSRFFSVPATSAPVERVFSQGGLLVRPHRAKLSDSMLEMLMMLRCNGK
jgi:hypothetical protein